MAKSTKTQIKPLSDLIATEENNKKSISKKIVKANNIEVKFKKLDENAVVPTYAHEGDIGMDITCTSVEYDEERDAFIYHTGLACETESNIGCFLMPRSSNTKTDSYLPNSIGLIDTYTYRGELLFIFKNRTDTDMFTAISAMIKYDELPVWKKIFTSFRSMWEKESNNFNPMDLAPYKVGDRIGQMVFFEHPTVQTKVIDELSKTVRGKGGFGSTGK